MKFHKMSLSKGCVSHTHDTTTSTSHGDKCDITATVMSLQQSQGHPVH